MNFLPEDIRRLLAVGLMCLAIFVMVGWLGSSLSSRLSSLTLGNKRVAPAQALESQKSEDAGSRSLLGGIVDSVKNVRFMSIDARSALKSIGGYASKVNNVIGAAVNKAFDFFGSVLSRDVSENSDKIKP